MAIREHPPAGTLLTCDFHGGFIAPEMVKRRLVVVVSPRIRARVGLCTVLALSTTAPDPVMPYHAQIDIRPSLPPRWQSDGVWIKGDMVAVVAFQRLDFIRLGRGGDGRRLYHSTPLDDNALKVVRVCLLRSLGLSGLTKHLQNSI